MIEPQQRKNHATPRETIEYRIEMVCFGGLICHIVSGPGLSAMIKSVRVFAFCKAKLGHGMPKQMFSHVGLKLFKWTLEKPTSKQVQLL
jgi:hypothetical protein